MGKAVLLPAALYIVWVLATYVFEGRVQLLMQPDPVGRVVYAMVANIMIGTAFCAWVLRTLLRSGVVSLGQLGFRGRHRTPIAVAIGLVFGLAVFVAQRPRSLEPLVLLNVFAQVLPTSIAEVLVCWAAIGTTTESLARGRGRAVSVCGGVVVAASLFGLYHFAHSPPFNQFAVVLFLTIIGVFTGLVYFIGRDIYAAVIVHNFFGMVGIIGSAELSVFRQPLYPVYALALVAVLILVGSDIFIVRRGISAVNLSAERAA